MGPSVSIAVVTGRSPRRRSISRARSRSLTPIPGGGVETVTLSVDFGILHLNAGSSGAIVSDSGTNTVTITGTIAQINAMLNTDPNSLVAFNGNFPSPPGSATLTMTINDNGNSDGGPLTDTETASILITIDQPPVVTPGSGSASFTEPTSGAPVAGGCGAEPYRDRPRPFHRSNG